MTVTNRLLTVDEAAQRLNMTPGDFKKLLGMGYFSGFKPQKGLLIDPRDLKGLKERLNDDPLIRHLRAPELMSWSDGWSVAWVQGDSFHVKTATGQGCALWLGDCS